MNGVAIALDLAAFGDPAEFAASVDDLSATIAAQPLAPGADALMVPGERGDAERARRLATGIPLPPNVWKQLGEAASRFGITPPAPL